MTISTRPKDDWYRTPPEVTRALLSVESFPGGIHDPFAGDGMMSAVLAEQISEVVASTITKAPSPALYEVECGVDVFWLDDPWKPHIVGNPPYGKLGGKVDRLAAEKVVRHCIDMLISQGPEYGKLALILDLRFLAGLRRRNELWSTYPPSRIWAFSDRVTMYPGTWEEHREPGTQWFGWFVWEYPFTRPGEHPIVRPVLDSRDFRNPADKERYNYQPVKSRYRTLDKPDMTTAAE